MFIRTATNQEQGAIRRVHQDAFSPDESKIISQLAVQLLDAVTNPPTFSLVAEYDNNIVGHVAFSPVTIAIDTNIQGYILAPLGVKPDFHQKGIGTQLIESGKRKLKQLGTHFLFVYGDPAYYHRFDFNTETANQFIPPYKLQYPFGWQACILNEYHISETTYQLTCVKPLSDPKLW